MYQHPAPHEEQNIEVEIENNTNMSYLAENRMCFEINGSVKTISGITALRDDPAIHPVFVFCSHQHKPGHTREDHDFTFTGLPYKGR